MSTRRMVFPGDTARWMVFPGGTAPHGEGPQCLGAGCIPYMEKKGPPEVTAETILPTGSAARKDIPVTTGVLDYFPAAIAEVARVSKVGNDKHNPGEPLHWARGKSMDHAYCIARHLLERGTLDGDGMRHSAMLAWRALALLQQELEEAGAPLARGAMVFRWP